MYYPAPTIFNSTLHVAGGANTPLYVAATTQGDSMFFSGTGFSTVAGENTITYGTEASPNEFICAQILSGSSDTLMNCQTESGDGSGLHFTVSVGPGTAAQVARGWDQYSYPDAPSVTAVSGCSPYQIYTPTGDGSHPAAPPSPAWPGSC